MNWKRKLAVLVVVICCGFVAVAWYIGGQLVAPVNRSVGPPPDDLVVESFSVDSESGSTLAGWYIPNVDAQAMVNAQATDTQATANSQATATSYAKDATVILLHPIRSNRKSMLSRARLFREAGFAVAMVDLQGHGESPGEQITIGYLESRDVEAAVRYVRERNPGHRIGVVGCSLGGAATLMAAPIDIDALVLESVYPDIANAVYNRVGMRLGVGKYLIAPALLVQLKPRLGIGVNELRPIDGLKKLACPVLIAAGDRDEHTTITETREMFDAAQSPKELVLFEGAEHEDLLAFDSELYRNKVLRFVIESLNIGEKPTDLHEQGSSDSAE